MSPQPTLSGRLGALCVAIALATYSCHLVTAASEQQQQLFQTGDGAPANPLKSLLVLEQKRHMIVPQSDDHQQAHKQQDDKHRYELKRRLNKLIDELVDSKFIDEQQTYPAMKKAKPLELRRAGAKSKKNWNDSDQEDLKQAADGDQKIVIIVKQQQPQSVDSEAHMMLPLKPALGGGSPAMDLFSHQNSVNSAQDLAALASENQPAPGNSRRPVNLAEHARKIMDDQFGIRRESLFSTNNHLGLKGVPKFGSEEEY